MSKEDIFKWENYLMSGHNLEEDYDDVVFSSITGTMVFDMAEVDDPTVFDSEDESAIIDAIISMLGGEDEDSALDRGSDHYRKGGIQPIEYIQANNLGFSEGNVVKYITRWKYKGGVDDLEKARHYIDMLIELAEGK